MPITENGSAKPRFSARMHYMLGITAPFGCYR
jgi:hypothetical protein